MEKKSKYYVVKSMRMCTYLMSNGFILVRTHEDRTNPNYNVFIFKDTPELREYMSKYKK